MYIFISLARRLIGLLESWCIGSTTHCSTLRGRCSCTHRNLLPLRSNAKSRLICGCWWHRRQRRICVRLKHHSCEVCNLTCFALTLLIRLLIAVPTNQHVRYFATFCITSGTFTIIGTIVAWCTCLSAPILLGVTSTSIFLVAHNLGSETKKATGIPIFLVIGQCGSILGSHIFPTTDGPSYMYVLIVKLAAMLLTCYPSYRTGFAGHFNPSGFPSWNSHLLLLVSCALELLGAFCATLLSVCAISHLITIVWLTTYLDLIQTRKHS